MHARVAVGQERTRNSRLELGGGTLRFLHVRARTLQLPNYRVGISVTQANSRPRRYARSLLLHPQLRTWHRWLTPLTQSAICGPAGTCMEQNYPLLDCLVGAGKTPGMCGWLPSFGLDRNVFASSRTAGPRRAPAEIVPLTRVCRIAAAHWLIRRRGGAGRAARLEGVD